MRVVIVGAGVAGCVMARALARLPGLDVTCLERVSRDDHSEAGTGLNVGPNSKLAMLAHDSELADMITAASLPWKHWRISLTDGTVLFDLPLSAVADQDGWRLRWSELYRVLREAAEGVISYECDITHIGRSASGPSRSVVEWSQGDKTRRLDDIDLLIGTDGRYSPTRLAFSGNPEIRQIGVSIFRLLVPDTSNGLIDDYEQWFNGPNRLLAFRVPPGHLYIAGTFPIPPDAAIPDELKTAAAMRQAYSPAKGAPSAQARWMIDQICSNMGDLHWARIQEADLLYGHAASGVLYLGDSAHGMVPTLGQGASQALEDACNAADLIAREWIAGRRDPRDWIAKIDAVRQPRVDFAMKFSVDATDTMLAGSDPVAGTLHKTEPEFMAKLVQLYREVPMTGAQPSNLAARAKA